MSSYQIVSITLASFFLLLGIFFNLSEQKHEHVNTLGFMMLSAFLIVSQIKKSIQKLKE